MAAPFTRWTIREAIPFALAQTPTTPKIEFESKDVVKMMELASRHNCPFSRQKLLDLGFRTTGAEGRQLAFEDVETVAGREVRHV